MNTATPEAARQSVHRAPCDAVERVTASPTPTIPAEYLDNAAAAAWLGVSAENLRKSRSVGTLCGLPAPAFLRLGVPGRSRVRYHLEELRRWMRENTTEHAPRDPSATAGQ